MGTCGLPYINRNQVCTIGEICRFDRNTCSAEVILVKSKQACFELAYRVMLSLLLLLALRHVSSHLHGRQGIKPE